MTRTKKDKHWMDCIQQFRVISMSDNAWCSQNGISVSSFYYILGDYAPGRAFLIP